MTCNNNGKLITVLNCKQVKADVPVYRGTCSVCGGQVEVVETWYAGALIKFAETKASRKGFVAGAVITGLALGGLWLGQKLSNKKKEKE